MVTKIVADIKLEFIDAFDREKKIIEYPNTVFDKEIINEYITIASRDFNITINPDDPNDIVKKFYEMNIRYRGVEMDPYDINYKIISVERE